MKSPRNKNNPRGPRASASQQFSVVVEDMRSQFKVFGEALDVLRAEVAAGFEQVASGFKQVHHRFEQVHHRFEQVHHRFEQVDRRFDQIDHRFQRVDQEIGLVKAAVIEHGHELRDVRSSVKRVEESLATKVDREEVEAIVERIAHPPSV